MPEGSELKDVPAESVGTKVQQVVRTPGVTQVECIKQSDGNWTIRAS